MQQSFSLAIKNITFAAIFIEDDVAWLQENVPVINSGQLCKAAVFLSFVPTIEI